MNWIIVSYGTKKQILLENKEITCNINNQSYYINVENTDSVIFSKIYNKYRVYQQNLQGKDIYLFTLYYEIGENDYFVRYKKDWYYAINWADYTLYNYIVHA